MTTVYDVANSTDWKLYFGDFLDDFRRTNGENIKQAPSVKADVQTVAVLSATVRFLCNKSNIKTPAWAIKTKPLKVPYFVSGYESLKTFAIIESPIEFKSLNVFVLDNFLERI